MADLNSSTGFSNVTPVPASDHILMVRDPGGSPSDVRAPLTDVVQSVEPGAHRHQLIRSYAIEMPAAADDIPIDSFNENLQISRIHACLKGGTLSSAPWTLRYSTDPSAAGTEVVVGGTTTTATTSLQVITAFDNPSIGSGNLVRLDPGAPTGSGGWLFLTIFYDPV